MLTRSELNVTLFCWYEMVVKYVYNVQLEHLHVLRLTSRPASYWESLMITFIHDMNYISNTLIKHISNASHCMFCGNSWLLTIRESIYQELQFVFLIALILFMTQSLQQSKIFPERLPKDFHGPIKPFRRFKPLAPPNQSDDCQLQKQSVRLNAWKRRKSDLQVQQQNRQFISHPIRTSSQNPEWLKSTFFYQQRNQQHLRQKDAKPYGIFGQQKSQKRTDFRRSKGLSNLAIYPLYDKSPFQFSWPENSTEKKRISSTRPNFFLPSTDEGRGRITRSHYEFQKEVTPKIGWCQQRDFSMRNTVVKIGHDRMINTNSIV